MFFCFYFVHQPNVKILIGQILRITQSVVLIGQRLVMQEHRSLLFHSFNMADISSDRLEHLLGETLRSLEDNGMKFVRKAEQKKAIRQLFEKKDLLAVLPTGYGKSLIFQLLVLLAKRAGNSASLLVIEIKKL